MGWTDWVRGLEIEPSIYAADFSRLGEQLETVMNAGARSSAFIEAYIGTGNDMVAPAEVPSESSIRIGQ